MDVIVNAQNICMTCYNYAWIIQVTVSHFIDHISFFILNSIFYTSEITWSNCVRTGRLSSGMYSFCIYISM